MSSTTYAIEDRTEWRHWVTPQPLRHRPIHRWYSFPHSFTDDLVTALLSEWGAGSDDTVLDPFVGAGTTVVAAQQYGCNAIGVDLSPLAVFVSAVKSGEYKVKTIQAAWTELQSCFSPRDWTRCPRSAYSQLVRDALPGVLLPRFHGASQAIQNLSRSQAHKDVFHLALLAILPEFSHAVPSGGWLKWTTPVLSPDKLLSRFEEQVKVILEDVEASSGGGSADVVLADARNLPLARESVEYVITSPPYPNRHDYTRVFGVELMFAFLSWEECRTLRYQTMQSHPESRPHRCGDEAYREPRLLQQALRKLELNGEEPRIINMLSGYFRDVYLSLQSIYGVLKRGGRGALVVGNAQYRNVPIEVDLLCAEIAIAAGLQVQAIRAVRYRGNSAQQMKLHGRHPSRESVVLFSK